jgi:hypothetical protein
MTSRACIFSHALALAAGSPQLRADDATDAKPAPAPKADAPPRPPEGRDEKKDDKGTRSERPPGPRGPGGAGETPGDRPERPEWGRPGGDGSRGRVLDQFSADELREMIRAVEGTSNKRLAEKMKDRFEEAIARKPQQLSKEQLEAALGVFQDREPHLYNRLKDSLEKDPQRVSAILAMQWPRLEKTIELKKTDRELYDAQTQEIVRRNESFGIWWRLHHAIKEKNEAEATKLKEELKAKLAEQHLARQAIRKLELARLNDKIKSLSAEITAEDEKSAEAIDKQFKEFVSRAENPPRWDRNRGDRDRGERGDRPERKDGDKKEPQRKEN